MVVLHFLDEGELGIRAHFEADKNVVRGAAFQQLGECLAVHLNIRRGRFAAIDDAGNDAGFAQPVDGGGADARARLGLDVEDFGHGRLLL